MQKATHSMDYPSATKGGDASKGRVELKGVSNLWREWEHQ